MAVKRALLARDKQVNVAHTVPRTEVEGPGVRFALWVQGCPMRCPGCCNPHLLEFKEASWRDVEAVAAEILATDGIEGVTFIGGEPFSQAQALANVAERVREGGLSVMIFSGFVLEHLRSGKVPGAERLLSACDILVDGPYMEARASRDRRYIGSDNQRIHFLSERYAYLAAGWVEGEDGCELRWTGDTLSINGNPHPELTELLSGGLNFFGEGRG